MDERWKAAFVILAGSLVRLAFWLTTPVTSDGCLNFATARQLAETYSLPPVGVPGVIPLWYPPLFHIVTAVLYKATGVLTLTPLFFGVAGLVMFYVFCRRFYPKYAFDATAVLAFLPFHVYYSGIGYFETLLFFLAVCAYYFYFRFLEKGGSRDLAYAVFMSALAALTHYHGLVPLLSISAHLSMKDWRKAAVFLACGLLLASPWYARNYIVFGNPVWPKVYGGYFPNDVEARGTPFIGSLTSLASAGKWASVFFDFWLGAPNSGEDVWENMAVGRQKYPLFDLFMVPWLMAITAFTAAALWGAYSMRRGKRYALPALIFAASLVPYASNGLARMFVCLVPFLPIAFAEGYSMIGGWRRYVPLAVAFALFMAGSYAYAYTYHNLRASYAPFFDEIKTKLPEGARLVMPFNVQDCLYYTGKNCLRVGTMGGATPASKGSVDSVLEEYGTDYVCCSSLNIDAYSPADNVICDRYKGAETVIDYGSGGIWGRCWKTG